jgi:hypothetical protein
MPDFGAKLTLAIASFALAGAAVADTSADWKKSATVYLWLPSLNGELRFGPPESGGTVDAEKILDSLEMAFMGAFELSRGELSFIGDIIYLDLEAEKAGNFVSLPDPSERSINADLGVKGWQLGFYGAHTINKSERLQLSALAGLRYLSLDVETQVGITGPGGERSRRFERSAEVWDGVVGFRGQFSLNDKWFVPFHADVGTGESELTWQALTGIGYRFENLDTQLVYRHLEWDQGDTDLMQSLSFSGPALALRWRF